MITISINGSEYNNLKRSEINYSLSGLARTCYFEITRDQINSKRLPFKSGDFVTVKIDGEQVFYGRFEVLKSSHDKRSKYISIEGRSKSASLIKSSLKPITFSPQITIKGIIEKVISELGIDLKVVNNAGKLKIFEKSVDKIVVLPGENAFNFINDWAIKSQVLLTDDGSGNIIIEKSSSSKYESPIEIFFDSKRNTHFIVSGDIEHNISNRFRKYIAISQLNPTSKSFSLDEKKTTSQFAEVIDDVMPDGQMVIPVNKSATKTELAEIANWHKNIARAKSIKYFVTTSEFNFFNESWKLNKSCVIKDEINDFEDELIVDEVSITETKTEKVARITFIDKDAYSNLPIQKKKKEDNSLASLFQ